MRAHGLGFLKVLIIVCLITSPVFAVEKPGTVSVSPPEYNIPEGKKQQWESIKNLVNAEYGVCIEHCGNDPKCKSRCSRVHQHSLDSEYKKLLAE
ncbi:MAG: hypothetical protein AB1390_01270 [Nitrospirota bacterium]